MKQPLQNAPAPSLDDDLRLMEEAAREAGALALSYLRSGFKTWTKADATPVTEADLAVDGFLRQTLTAKRNYGWLSEESEADPARLEAETVFIVDPIDGTRAFARGRSDWVISIGLVRGGVPVAGAIFNPMEERMFLARRGGGATLNGAPLRLGGPGDLSRLALASENRHLARALESAGRPAPSVVRCFAFAYRLCLVATGEVDATVTFRPKRDWDIAAGEVILTEAGGKVSDGAGNPLRYNRADTTHHSVIAAGPLHGALQSLLENQL